MDRRTLLQASGLGVLGLTAGCAVRGARGSGPGLGLVPVRASWDRIIRTTVGLRPHRPAGFVVRAEALDDKTLVHNYGHGGAGHSLGWGTAHLAADLTTEQESRRAAVIGCGTAGLTTARVLQRRGFAVTIYAKAVPPDTTSNMALAGFTPTSGLVDPNERTAAWEAQFRRAVDISYRQLQLLAGSTHGVSWVDSYQLLAQAPSAGPAAGSLSSLMPEYMRREGDILPPGEHPFPAPFVRRRPTMRIEPGIYLEALVHDVLRFGGQIVIRSFDTVRDLAALDETLIVNCSGLGARTLVSDTTMIPVKGQLTIMVPQADVNYETLGGLPGRPRRGLPIHMMPRRDGIALGGTAERGEWSLEPNEEALRDIVGQHIEVFAAMTAAQRNR